MALWSLGLNDTLLKTKRRITLKPKPKSHSSLSLNRFVKGKEEREKREVREENDDDDDDDCATSNRLRRPRSTPTTLIWTPAT